MNTRIRWLDSLKGIAIILVIIRHVMQSNILNCSETIVGNVIFAVQMPLFMIIAGYFSITSVKYYETATGMLKYIKKRAFHYILPFFSWYIGINVLLRGFYSRNVALALETLANNVDVGLWFLYVVFVLSAVLIVSKYICFKLKIWKTNTIIPVIVGGVILLPLILLGKQNGFRFMGINLIVYYYLYFVLGYLIYSYRNLVNTLFSKRKVRYITFLVSTIIFTMIVFHHNIELSGDEIINIVLRVVAALTGCLSIALVVFDLPESSKMVEKKLEVIGQYTLELYVVHVQYIGLLPKGQYYFYTIDGLIIFIVALVITVILSLVTIYVINELPVFKMVLFGKK